MKARLFVISVLAVGLALILVWAVAAQGTETKPEIRPDLYGVSAPEDYQNDEQIENLSYDPDIASADAFTAYLPFVQRFIPPCTIAPTLISPTNSSTLDTLIPRLTYMRGTDPVSYTIILIADNPAFNPVIRYTTSGGAIGPHQLRLFENLEPATTYYWRVQDVCGSVYSPYAPTFAFTTGSGGVILPAPTLLSPAHGTVGAGEEVTLTWSSVTGAVGYQIWTRRVGIGGGGVSLAYTNSKVMSYLQPNTTYEWWVEAYNDYAYGAQSDSWQFTTDSFALLQEDVGNLSLEMPYTVYHPAEGSSSYVTDQRR